MSEFYSSTDDDVRPRFEDYEDARLTEIYGDGYKTLSARVKLLYTYAMRDDRVMMLALFRQLSAADCARMLPLHREAIGYLLQIVSFRGEIDWLAELVSMWRRGDFAAASTLLDEHQAELDSTAVSLLLRVRTRLWPTISII